MVTISIKGEYPVSNVRKVDTVTEWAYVRFEFWGAHIKGCAVRITKQTNSVSSGRFLLEVYPPSDLLFEDCVHSSNHDSLLEAQRVALEVAPAWEAEQELDPASLATEVP